ncbi:MAG TPA: hypothetical protein VE869_00930 [Gemmatimonas sp.]|nr:hypothetical protein [Gemmatimonas sp.]
MHHSRYLLWVDSGAGLLAGVVVLALSSWLSELYALPRALLLGMAAANLAYGTFSGSLALRTRRPRPLLVLLVLANAAWAALCGAAAWIVAGQASAFGLAHLIAEGVFVCVLAVMEWRHREQLLFA